MCPYLFAVQACQFLDPWPRSVSTPQVWASSLPPPSLVKTNRTVGKVVQATPTTFHSQLSHSVPCGQSLAKFKKVIRTFNLLTFPWTHGFKMKIQLLLSFRMQDYSLDAAVSVKRTLGAHSSGTQSPSAPWAWTAGEKGLRPGRVFSQSWQGYLQSLSWHNCKAAPSACKPWEQQMADCCY